MMKSKLYLALQAVICVALAAGLSLAAISIYREGSARKAEHPMESVYTPEIVAGSFAPIAPLLIAGAILLVAGLALGIRDESAEKPARDAALDRDLMVSRVARPSGVMLAEQRRQKRLMWIGWSLFALCMVPVLAYLLDPAHFPQDDLEGMLSSLLRVLLPWTAVGLGALAATSILREKNALRETEAARTQLKAESAAGVAAAQERVEPPRKAAMPRAILIAVAVALILIGMLNGSARDVLYKAITICTECVGLG